MLGGSRYHVDDEHGRDERRSQHICGEDPLQSAQIGGDISGTYVYLHRLSSRG